MTKFRLVALTTSIFALLVSGCITQQTAAQPGEAAVAADKAANQPVKDIRIVISTNKGDIHATLFASRVPMTVANFVNLAQHKFYDGLIFHRVIADFMAQVGDPLTRDPSQQRRWGTGGPGYSFPDEIDRELKHDRKGIFSMANSGPNTNGSQIFITHGPTPHLNGKHAVFGQVTQGMDILLAIKKGDQIKQVKVLDDAMPLLNAQAANVQKWNAVLGDTDF